MPPTASKLQLNVIHISDLHFGSHHVFNPEAPDPGHPSLAGSLITDIARRKIEGPVICCVSGDLTQTHNDVEYKQAREALMAIAGHSCFQHGLDDFFLVQGNHDVNYEDDAPFVRWSPWRNLIQHLYPMRASPIDAVSLDLLWDRVDDLGAVVVTLNSAVFVRKGVASEINRGRLGSTQLQRLRDALREFDPLRLRSAIRIAVVHHHPVLIPTLREIDRDYDAIAEAEILLTTLRQYGFHIVLHGHKHLPLVLSENAVAAYTGDIPGELLVVSGGSVGSTELPPGPAARNTYNWIILKWLPEALQARVQIETRALRQFSDTHYELPATEWTWETLKIQERILAYGQAFPPVRVADVRDFTPGDDAEREKSRRAEYERTRGNLPVVELVPSLETTQAFEARAWLVHHVSTSPGVEDDNSYPNSVTWSAGQRFPVKTIERSEDPAFATAFEMYAAMLVQAELTFPDGKIERVHTYVRMPTQYPGTS